jgi:hypothetical protein
MEFLKYRSQDIIDDFITQCNNIDGLNLASICQITENTIKHLSG